jgi:uncharacterized protein YpmB
MTKKNFKNIVLFAIVIIALSLGGFFFYKLQKIKKNNPDIVKKEAQELLTKVSRLYLVSTNETPTVATVSDPDKLKDQAFFSESQKGDKVLIFTQSGKAVLYRPSIDKIIAIAPFDTQTPNATNVEN